MAFLVQLQDDVAAKKFPINKPVLRIGRDPESDIFIDNDVVSMDHAVVEMVENPGQGGDPGFYIRDLQSTNNTFLNGKKVTRQKLEHNDVLRIGWNSFKFIDDVKADPDDTTKIHKSWIPGVYYTKK